MFRKMIKKVTVIIHNSFLFVESHVYKNNFFKLRPSKLGTVACALDDIHIL